MKTEEELLAHVKDWPEEIVTFRRPMKTHIWYHANCNDGFAAATIIWRHWLGVANYVPCQYGRPLPEAAPGDLVIMVDFSAKRSEILAMREAGIDVKVLDHHKTAEAELEGLPDCTFDMNECGATLAWKWLYRDRPLPAFLLYIRDRDLWLKQYETTDLIRAGLETVPQEFEVWSNFLDSEGLDRLKEAGAIVKRMEEKTMQSALKNVRMITLDGHFIPVLNTTTLMSDLGERLCNLYPDSPFSATYRDGSDKRAWSLRSRGGFDVSEVAKKFGGGGHKAASGFTTPIPEQSGFLIPSNPVS